ncbi:hypothetical protein N8009_01485 [Flavobacteriaceae bacterium]|nr:hypothetical protein [Flavobacteriaceae bacterium]
MKLTKDHIDFESNLKRLVGQKLSIVEYLEINYEEGNPKPYYKTRFNEIDTVDFSITFQTDKEKIEFYWDGQFYQYGIGVRFNETGETATGQKWDVSKNELWQKFIGQKINNVRVTWEEVTTYEEKSGRTEKFIYPQDLKIVFANNKSIFMSAAGFLNEDDKEVMGLMDNLTVTGNENLARQVKMIN